MQSRFIFNGKTLWATETGEYESFSVLKPKVYPSDILKLGSMLRDALTYALHKLIETGHRLLYIACPIDIVVTDELGREIVIMDGQVKVNEIPGAMVFTYNESYTLILPDNLTYSMEVIGKDNGKVYALSIAEDKGNLVTEEYEFYILS